MLELDGVIDAYFEDRIEVLVSRESPELLEEIEDVIAENAKTE